MIKLFKYLLLLIILFFCRKSFALQVVLDKGYEIRKLSSLKWEYEQNLFLKKSDKADSLLVLYRRQLELIKKPKNDFLKFINIL
ncbi:hypothetical protein [Pedobacter sp.]